MNKSDLWQDNDEPDSLYFICLKYILENYKNTFFCNGCRENIADIYLPNNISEELIKKSRELKLSFDIGDLVKLYSDAQRLPLQIFELDSNIDSTIKDDEFLEILKTQKLTQVRLSSTSLSRDTINSLHIYSPDVILLSFGAYCENIFNNVNNTEADFEYELEFIPNPNPVVFNFIHLRYLIINHLRFSSDEESNKTLIKYDLQYLIHLVYLDLSDSNADISYIYNSLINFKYLSLLNLHNIDLGDIEETLNIISKVTTLRALDIGQSIDDSPHNYINNVEDMMKGLLNQLKTLNHLELCGTNLAGRPVIRSFSIRSKNIKDDYRTMSWIAENRRLEYLGLLNCTDHPCQFENIPANKVSGDANVDQMLSCLEEYLYRGKLLLSTLNSLFDKFRSDEITTKQSQKALTLILNAMDVLSENREVQISGSASLFYIVKGEELKKIFTLKVKKQIIRVLLNAMELFHNERIMQRNGCLTLCHFKLPQEVMHDYSRIVRLLLSVANNNQTFYNSQADLFVQRIAIYLLNSLACQVDYEEKKIVGDLQAFKIMLSTILYRLNVKVCDEVMEVAWSMMWNATDETPPNCERFLENDGLQIFHKCLLAFPTKTELLRNMMGLLGNVAEVPHLRTLLVTVQNIEIFVNLLESTDDGIEISYNACGVLANIMADGEDEWIISEPKRYLVLERMTKAINRWPLNSERFINYRSFKPILKLLEQYHTPEVQHWSVWALCNLTKVYRSKYCPLLEAEGGIHYLKLLIRDPRTYPMIKLLAHRVIRRCLKFRGHPDDLSDDDDDDSIDIESLAEKNGHTDDEFDRFFNKNTYEGDGV